MPQQQQQEQQPTMVATELRITTRESEVYCYSSSEYNVANAVATVAAAAVYHCHWLC